MACSVVLEAESQEPSGSEPLFFSFWLACFRLLGRSACASICPPLFRSVCTSRRTKTAAQLVEFCPAEPYAHLAIARGYRDAGVCADGAAPLLKPVIAQPGDVVEVLPAGLSVNGRRLPNTAPIEADTKGRTLAAWPAGKYEVRPGTIWVASSYNRRSFDSRYFGPIALAAVRDRVKPLITGGK